MDDPLALCFEESSPETTLTWLRDFLEERNASAPWCAVSEVEAPVWNHGWLGRGVADLEDERFDRLVSAVEHSDLILFTQAEALTGKERRRAEKTVRLLRPDADVVFLSDLPERQFALSRRFSWERTAGGCSWREATRGTVPEAFVYRSRAPFQPERLARFIDEHTWLGYRATGTMWLLTRPELAVFASRTGFGTLLLEPEGLWIATLSPSDRAAALKRNAELAAKWDAKHGDRHTELVFLGLNAARRQRIRAELDSCLATEWERAAFAHGRLNVPDPLTGDWGKFNEGEETV